MSDQHPLYVDQKAGNSPIASPFISLMIIDQTLMIVLASTLSVMENWGLGWKRCLPPTLSPTPISTTAEASHVDRNDQLFCPRPVHQYEGLLLSLNIEPSTAWVWFSSCSSFNNVERSQPSTRLDYDSHRLTLTKVCSSQAAITSVLIKSVATRLLKRQGLIHTRLQARTDQFGGLLPL